MYLRWRERLQHEPSLRDINEWPLIECDVIPSSGQKNFLRNQRMVSLVLSGKRLMEVAKLYNLSCATISQLMERCLGGDDSDVPPLTEGLIPHRRVVKSRRRSELPSLQKYSGARCAFQALLAEVPGLSSGLDNLIKEKLRDSNRAQTLTPESFHGAFKRLLKVAGHPHSKYPYTTKSVAYESVRQYLAKRTREIQLLNIIEKDQRKSKITSISTNKDYRALKNIQIDEQVADFHGRLTIELNGELIPLRVARSSILLCIDADTNCYLGFHLAYTPAPNQQDLIQLFNNVIRPWTPIDITTPGLEYMPGACFPSGLPNSFPITFGTLHLDNAWIHRAKSVRQIITDQLGATVHLGRPAQPKQRNWVEAAFAYINQHATHRFPSTSGSHPKDPIKESRKNSKKIPEVSIQTLLEALSIILTNHNITPCPQLGGQSPLSLFKQHCANNYIRYTPDILRKTWHPFEDETIVPIKTRTGSSTPHINFYQVRYTGSGLAKAALQGKDVTIRFDKRDIRELKIYGKGKRFLGIVRASKSWQRFPHSLAARQYIFKLIRTHRLHANDPLANFMHLLLTKMHHPKGALQLLRFYNEFSDNSNELEIISPKNTKPKNENYLHDEVNVMWTPSSANQRIKS